MLHSIESRRLGTGSTDHLWLAWGIFITNFIWTLLISLLALAISAWVRWKVVAGGMLLVIFFLGSGLAQAINAILRTNAGYWIDIGYADFGQHLRTTSIAIKQWRP